VAAAVVVGAAAVLRMVELPSPPPDPGRRFFNVLLAGALLDFGVVMRARSPGTAWFATLAAAGLGGVEVAAAVRSMGLVTDGVSTPIGLALTFLPLLVASGVAVANVARPRAVRVSPLDRTAVGAAWLTLTAAAVAAGWGFLSGLTDQPQAPVAGNELTPTRFATRVALTSVAFGLAAGALLDMRRGANLAWARWRAGEPVGSAPRSLFGHLADELVPWRADGQSQAREGERARLAADLHALVLPDLRRAAAAVESAGAPAPAVAGVRRALEDVEQLVHGRQSIVLEQFGLVAALEWLAERTEEQGMLQVELRLEGEQVDRRDAVTPEIGRAAFRIAMLALDNVQRHAQATSAIVRLRVEPDDLHLAISDDGVAGQGWSRSGGRGVHDMRAEARSTGGVLELRDDPRTTVEVRWRRS
jgi:signal transduction histidine kinase